MNPLRSLTMAALCILWAGPLHAQAFPSLLDPADPKRAGKPPHYAPVTSGLKRFGVVEPKDWLTLNRAVGPQGASSAGKGNVPGSAEPMGRAIGGDR